MGMLREQVKKMITQNALKSAETLEKRLEDEKLQRAKISEFADVLFYDLDFLDQLGVALSDATNGDVIRHPKNDLTAISFFSSEEIRSAVFVTVEFCCDTYKYTAVEWGDRFSPTEGNRPFEVKRTYFDSKGDCINWVAELLIERLEMPLLDAALAH